MPADPLITILEDIRDHQKRQIANFERAMATQDEAMAVQRQWRRFSIFLVFMPWLLVLILMAIVLFRPLLDV